jgi:hypothetical protein
LSKNLIAQFLQQEKNQAFDILFNLPIDENTKEPRVFFLIPKKNSKNTFLNFLCSLKRRSHVLRVFTTQTSSINFKVLKLPCLLEKKLRSMLQFKKFLL